MMSSRTAVSTFFFVNGFIYANWATRLPTIKETYDLTESNIGWILLAHAAGSLIGMPVTGWLIAVYGSRRVTYLSGILLTILLLTIPFTTGYVGLLAAFLGIGCSVGILDISMNAQAVDVEKGLGKPIMTMFHALFSIGMVVGALLAGLLADMGWQLLSHFALIGTSGLLLILIAVSSLHPPNHEKQAEGAVFALPSGPVVALGIIAFCCMMGEGAVTDWSTLYLREELLVPVSMQAYGLSAFAAMMTLGRLFGDKGRGKYGDGRIMLTGASLALLGIVCVVAVQHVTFAIIGFALIGIGLSTIVPIVYSLSGNIEGLPAGTGIAMATTIGYSGFMVGPPVIGFISEATSLRYGLGCLLVTFAVMLVLVGRYVRRRGIN